MPRSSAIKPDRFKSFTAILIAIVSITAALAAWRTSVLASDAGNASRQGLIDAVKKQAAENENIRRLYEEAAHARDYTLLKSDIEVYSSSPAAGHQVLAANLREYMLPALEQLGQPLTNDPTYELPNGSFDLRQRLSDLTAEDPDLAALDPQSSFATAAGLSAKRRLLTIAAVIFVLSLFWLGLAEVVGHKLRKTSVLAGLGIYLLGLLWWAGAEIGLINFN